MSLNKKNYLDEELWNCVFNNQISDDIKWAIHSDRCLVAAQLLLAAIDVISGIERPKNENINTSNRYISWCNTYIKMTGEHYKLTGNDLWGARCGFLHGYTHLSTEVVKGRASIDRVQPRCFLHGHQHCRDISYRGRTCIMGVYGEKNLQIPSK